MEKKILDIIQKEIIDLPKTKKTSTVLGKEKNVMPVETFWPNHKKDNQKFKGIPEALDKIIGETFRK